MAENFANDVSGVLSSAIADGTTTTINMVSATGFPAVNFRIRIDDEYMLVTSLGTGLNWTVTRGIEGTTAIAHSSGAAVYQIVTLAGLQQYITDRFASLGANTFTGLQTLAAGADIASAATIDLTAATGNTAIITGTTPTSAITMNAGQQMVLIAAAAWPLTHNATTNNINGGADYTCAAGDRVTVVKDGGGVIRTSVVVAAPYGTTLTLSPFAISTTTTQAHGLGAVPSYCVMELVCLTAEFGYSIGDRLEINSGSHPYVTGGTDCNIVLKKDATNVVLVVSNNSPIPIARLDTNAISTITPANWKITVVPYK